MEGYRKMSDNSIPDEALIPAPKARRDWWGGIGETTEWRWSQQFDDFPTPVRINNRKFYRAGDIRRFNRVREAA